MDRPRLALALGASEMRRHVIGQLLLLGVAWLFFLLLVLSTVSVWR